MNNEILHKKELEFFGKVTACISHELNNVLSIVNEYTGLLEDILQYSNETNIVEKEKIQKIIKNISDQIIRKKDLIKLLNRFAHRVDSTITTFNLIELINDLGRITQRFASLKRVTLEVNVPNEQLNITTSPFILMHVLFQTINLGLDFCDSNDSISIQTENKKLNSIVTIITPTIEINNEVSKNIEFISYLLKLVSGKVEISSEGANQKFSLSFSSCINELLKNN